MGQSLVSDESTETAIATVGSIDVDTIVIEKAESVNNTAKIRQVSAFFFISFYPTGNSTEASLGKGKISGKPFLPVLKAYSIFNQCSGVFAKFYLFNSSSLFLIAVSCDSRAVMCCFSISVSCSFVNVVGITEVAGTVF